ncbi:MAG: rhomboid family intramembrane serine protease [Flavobacteriales bacterium]|nr:rhomboid family intramembrane serine protease [Flavobacteriales bacterium]
MALLDDIKFQFRTGNILMQLIYVNSGIFLLMMILRLIFFLVGSPSTYDLIEHYLSVPSSPTLLLFRPWTLITHMFVHAGFLHILFNMLWLQFGGTIFLNFLDSKKLFSTYILGGLSGALLFILAMNLFPAFSGIASVALGASAAVLAIVVAAATMAPNYLVRLVLIGPVKLKYIALVSVLLDVLMIPSGNAGGHLGHLGGALFGFIYASQLKRGNDLTVDFLKPIFWLRDHLPSRRKKKIKVVHRRAKTDAEFNEEKQTTQEQVDAILDKIKRSGYDSLSQREKEILFKAKDKL